MNIRVFVVLFRPRSGDILRTPVWASLQGCTKAYVAFPVSSFWDVGCGSVLIFAGFPKQVACGALSLCLLCALSELLAGTRLPQRPPRTAWGMCLGFVGEYVCGTLQTYIIYIYTYIHNICIYIYTVTSYIYIYIYMYTHGVGGLRFFPRLRAVRLAGSGMRLPEGRVWFEARGIKFRASGETSTGEAKFGHWISSKRLISIDLASLLELPKRQRCRNPVFPVKEVARFSHFLSWT